MDKVAFPFVLVVEGAMDQAFLSQFIECDFVQTNGSAVSRETIEYIRALTKNRDVVVLTDPDAPGERIRALIANEVPAVKHAFVRKERSIKGKKVGVAESSREEVLLALSSLVPGSSAKGTLTSADLASLGLMGGAESSALRKRVSETFHMGDPNAKTFLRRANALGLTKEDLEKAIHG